MMEDIMGDTPTTVPVEPEDQPARQRWGPDRGLHLEDLEPVTREIVLTIIAARRDAAKRAAEA